MPRKLNDSIGKRPFDLPSYLYTGETCPLKYATGVVVQSSYNAATR